MAVKSLSRLLKSLNAKHHGAYHFCVNCMNGFRTKSARDKHYLYCSSHGEVNIKMPRENEKWLKFHDGQCQFKVPFMLYADFESILKPVEASNLDEDQCKNLRKFFDDEEEFRLMRRKGVYPYEYVDSWEKFEETELPSKEAFYFLHIQVEYEGNQS